MSRILRRRSRPRWPRWHRVGRWTQAEIDAVRERAHEFDVLFTPASVVAHGRRNCPLCRGVGGGIDEFGEGYDCPCTEGT